MPHRRFDESVGWQAIGVQRHSSRVFRISHTRQIPNIINNNNKRLTRAPMLVTFDAIANIAQMKMIAFWHHRCRCDAEKEREPFDGWKIFAHMNMAHGVHGRAGKQNGMNFQWKTCGPSGRSTTTSSNDDNYTFESSSTIYYRRD